MSLAKNYWRIDIASAIYANPADRDRLKKLLQEHGAVADFEFEMRRKDGEIRTVLESSIAVRDYAGNVTAYQGFVLDITERKRAEHEIRRRNRELLVLNSIAQTLTESMDLSDSLHRTLRQMAELFSLDACALYLFDEEGTKLRRVAAVGHRSEYARHFPPVTVKPELLAAHQSGARDISFRPGTATASHISRSAAKEELLSAYLVVLWSKDRVIGGLAGRQPHAAGILTRRRQPAHCRGQPDFQRHRTYALSTTNPGRRTRTCDVPRNSSCTAKRWPPWGN